MSGKLAILDSAAAALLFEEQGLNIVIPNHFTSVDYLAFYGYQLDSIVIADSVTSIGDWAFATNQLTSIVIPASVISIGDHAFDNNPLITASVSSGADFDPSAFPEDTQIITRGEDPLTSDWAERLFAQQGSNIAIPNIFTSIDDWAFQSLDVTSVVIPDSVNSIGNYAFAWTPLSSVAIPDSVSTIGASAFESANLSSISIPAGISEIQSGTFAGNNLTSIEIPDSVVSIQGNSSMGGFQANDLISVDIPDSVIFIGENAFKSNQLEDVEIGEGVTIIGERAFEGNLINSIYIPDNVEEISSEAFANNPLAEVSISAMTSFDFSSFPQGTEIIRRGVPLIDSDGDGFVDEVTNYQMWTESGGVDLQTRTGRTFSDDSSPQWDAIKAVEDYSGFSVLLEGERRKDGQYRVITANDSGVIGGVTPWMRERQMFRRGYEEVFDIDFNDNGVIDFI